MARSVLGIVTLAALAGGSAAQDTDTLVVTTAWLAGRLEEPSVVILHLDDREAYDSGHIPGARFLDHMALVGTRDGTDHQMASVARLLDVLEQLGVSGSSRVVVYGDPLSAARTVVAMEFVGLRGRAALLEGGLTRWREEGRPLEREAPSVSRGTIGTSPGDGVIVTADWVHDRLGDPTLVLVDARPDDDYRRGRIPGARSVYWHRLMVDDDLHALRPAAVLRALLAEAGYTDGAVIVSYCLIGLRASMVYVAARSLGYDVRMYDGSWSEWSRLPGLPIER